MQKLAASSMTQSDLEILPGELKEESKMWIYK